MKAPVILKFGGACFLGSADFTAVAGYVAERIHGGRQAVLVASAMSGTSGNLEELVRQVNPAAPPPLAAGAISTADQLSAGLLAAALAAAGIGTCLLTFDRTGLVADGDAMRATLRLLSGDPLSAALKTHQAVVLPGGQGRDGDGGLVMLGRNSSDLSAVAMAVITGAAECEIFSEVPGIYSADPRIVPDARPLRRLPYQLALDIARCGAKILHHEAVELAARHHIRIICRGRPPAAIAVSEVTSVGQWQPAVVADQRAVVWRFPGWAAARQAREQLAGAGIQALVHDDGLVLDPGVAAAAVATLERLAGRQTDLRLLSVLRTASEPPERYLIPATELAAAARAQHRLLYPEPAESAVLKITAQANRSPFSQVLFSAPPEGQASAG
jgi:aspartate kinase